MTDEIRIPFGILLRTDASRYFTIKNLTTGEKYPTVRGEHKSNNKGDLEISCANFTSGHSRGNVIRFSANGLNDIQEDVTIPITGGNVKVTTTSTTRYPGAI